MHFNAVHDWRLDVDYALSAGKGTLAPRMPLSPALSSASSVASLGRSSPQTLSTAQTSPNASPLLGQKLPPTPMSVGFSDVANEQHSLSSSNYCSTLFSFDSLDTRTRMCRERYIPDQKPSDAFTCHRLDYNLPLFYCHIHQHAYGRSRPRLSSAPSIYYAPVANPNFDQSLHQETTKFPRTRKTSAATVLSPRGTRKTSAATVLSPIEIRIETVEKADDKPLSTPTAIEITPARQIILQYQENATFPSSGSAYEYKIEEVEQSRIGDLQRKRKPTPFPFPPAEQLYNLMHPLERHAGRTSQTSLPPTKRSRRSMTWPRSVRFGGDVDGLKIKRFLTGGNNSSCSSTQSRRMSLNFKRWKAEKSGGQVTLVENASDEETLPVSSEKWTVRFKGGLRRIVSFGQRV